MTKPWGGLSADQRTNLVEIVEKRRARVRSDTRQGSSTSYDRALDFSTLPGAADVQVQRQIGGLLGLENPFFRIHERRAGADTLIGGVQHDNFSSYDYLGLNGQPAVAEAAKSAIDLFGTSASASRVVGGERPPHGALEGALAQHYEAESALIFVSGHATNVATLSSILGPRDLLLHDAFAHNSILVGARLAGCERHVFPHNDLVALNGLLERLRPRHERTMIVVEGVYSMDGDLCDLAALIALKRRHGAWLMVDEAHAFGTIGASGHGSFEEAGVDPRDVDIWMGTLSKTLAGCGGYIAGKRAMVEHLRHFAAGFVYSVGVSPPLAAASFAALTLVAGEPERVKRLQANGAHFLACAKAAGLDTGLSRGLSIVPIVVRDSLLAVALSQRLFKRGINVQPIIHPAVPERAARLRFFMTSEHEFGQIERAVAATRDELAYLGSSKEIFADPSIVGR